MTTVYMVVGQLLAIVLMAGLWKFAGWITTRRVTRAATCKLPEHFNTPTKNCFDYGCTDDCPVSAKWRDR